MRKILYSPGYGAGWTTWGGDTPEQKKFMLEYAPFIAFIEGGGKFPSHPDGDPYTTGKGEAHPLVAEFKAEWKRRWPGSVKLEHDGVEYGYPCFLGLDDLKVYSVAPGARVRIDEYDGYESVAVEGANEDQWL